MIKKLLLSSAATLLAAAGASAADLPRRQAPPVFTQVPVFTWTGGFAGLESAYTFTDRERITTTGVTPAATTALVAGQRIASTSTEQDGIAKLGGGFGYNYQFTPGSGFVVGVAANFDWTDIHKGRVVNGTPSVVGGAPTPNAFRQSLEWLGTATGRIGYAFDRFLIYGTGGFAFGDVQYDATFYSGVNGALTRAGRYTDLETGYAYGGGVEYAIPTDSVLNYFSVGKYLGIKSEAVTIKAEYLHYDLGNRNVSVNAAPLFVTPIYTSRFRTEGNIVRAGFNYKFGGF